MFLKFNTSRPDTDLELVEKYRNSRDKKYVGELFQRYTHFIYGICFKHFKNQEKAKDAVMEIFEKLLTELKLHNIKQFKAWLYFVTKNHCLMDIRKMQVHGNNETAYKKFKQSDMESDYLSHLKDKEQKLTQLEENIKQLNEEQRTCIELFYLENKSYHEIVDITSFDIKQVKSHIQNGKRNLKNIMLSDSNA